jgi:DNA adenine methylase
MYRVNSEGKFNVPWGHNPHEDMSYFFNLDNVKTTAEYLRESVSISCESYSDAIDRHLIRASKSSGLFFYLDPPYAPLDKDIERGNFTAYTTFPGWDLKEQIILRAKCEEIDKAGQKFMLSNSSCKLVKDLYKKFNILEVDARRMISAKKETRGGCKEVIVTNY